MMKVHPGYEGSHLELIDDETGEVVDEMGCPDFDEEEDDEDYEKA